MEILISTSLSPMNGQYSLTCMAYTLEDEGNVVVVEILNKMNLTKSESVDLLNGFISKYRD